MAKKVVDKQKDQPKRRFPSLRRGKVGKTAPKTEAEEKRRETKVAEAVGPREALAVGRYLKIAPTKVRGVLDLIRGEPVGEAERILRFSPRRGAKITLKVLNSAVANARSKGPFTEKGWTVSGARADKGPVFRRKIDPKARGGRGLIATPSTHLTITIKQDLVTDVAAKVNKKENKREKRKVSVGVKSSRKEG